MAEKSISKITILLFILRIIRIFISIVTLTFSAKYFGVSIERDTWILVTTVITTVGNALWGPINETFRAKFIFIKSEEGENKALKKVSSLLGFIILATLVIGVITGLCSEYISRIMMQGSIKDLELFSLLLLIMLPTLLINQLVNIGISILNAYDIFYLPEIIGTITGLFSLAIIAFSAPIIGIYSLAISQYVSITVLLLVIFLYIRKKRIAIWGNLFLIRWEYISGFIIFALPFFFPYFVGQCNGFMEKWLAGQMGTGIVSSLDYSRQFTIVMQGVLSGVLSTVMIPTLSKFYCNKDYVNCGKSLLDYLKVCSLILCCVLPFLIGAADPICNFFFNRGNIDTESLNLIIKLSQLYGIAFIGIIFYLIFGVTLLSINKGKTYALYGVITQILMLIINLSLCGIYKSYVFPISLLICHAFSSCIMLLKCKEIIDLKLIFFKLIKLIVLLSIYTITVFFINQYIPNKMVIDITINLILFLIIGVMSLFILGYNIRKLILR